MPMKTSERDSRKPEMAIYRPGMGLHNKTNKCENRCDQTEPKSTSVSENCILEQLNDNEAQRNSHEITKSSKNKKSRRPDIHVYVPKPKFAEQLINKKTDVKNGSQSPVVREESAQRRNKEKRNEQTLPPRFQKNKKQSQDNHPNPSSKYNNSSVGSGGLLNLPENSDQPTSHSKPVDNSIYVPKMYHKPQVFIPETLFDPNNPNNLEIVNCPIPAPHPPPHMPYSNMNNDYFSPEISYIQQSLQSIGYIPPPQPPAMNRQYYGIPDVKMNITPDSYLNRREIIPPPIPKSVYCRPSLPFAEMRPVPPEGGKERIKPVGDLEEISMKERELSVLLTKGLDEENFYEIQCCRFRLQSIYEKIILADPTYCAERNPEERLWKTTFQHIIELWRKKLEENPSDPEAIKEKLIDVINQGTHFCQHLIEKMEEEYEFDLAKLLESDTVVNMSLVPERIRVVLISVQKLHVCLGDLARYKEQVNQTSYFGRARSYYQKASQMLPENGRPYYQQALLSVSTRRKLDAVYFYIRSLSASNPILSAKESLLTLFDEVKRKYEKYEKKRIQEIPIDVENLNKNIGKRVEVWIKPDGSSNHRPAEMDNNLDFSDIKHLSDVELNKRFVTSFLHVHGKLFTKVGMETFPDTLNQMLKEFYFLLQRTPLPVTSSRLMQLIAINIFSVENSSSKDNGREYGGVSLLQEQALYTSKAMMSILMERCHMLQIAHKSSPEFSNQMLSDDLAEVLPSVKIWTDWMSCRKCLWPSPASSVLKEINIGFAKNIWSSFADLLTVLREVNIKYPNTSSTQDPDCETLILEEDNYFAGFVPLLGALQDPIYVRKPFDKVLSKHAVRINRIQFFEDYLCGITPICMQFDVKSKNIVPLVDQVYSGESFEGSVLHNTIL